MKVFSCSWLKSSRPFSSRTNDKLSEIVGFENINILNNMQGKLFLYVTILKVGLGVLKSSPAPPPPLSVDNSCSIWHVSGSTFNVQSNVAWEKANKKRKKKEKTYKSTPFVIKGA